ncbi:MAG: GNAT family N-acetyltransferase [Polyangia bacterium]
MADAERLAIRRARPGDSAAVRTLVKQLGYSPDDRAYDETFTQVARHPEAAVFVAHRSSRVVGYLAMTHRPQIRIGGRVASVDELAVDGGDRGAGAGTLLLEAAVAHARSLGCARIEVLCSRARESYTRGFYETRGMAEIETAVYRLDLRAPGPAAGPR